MILDKIFSRFENHIDPFDVPHDHRAMRPPSGAFAFIWFYVSQAKLPFFAMLVTGGLVAAMEVSLFYFMSRIIDVLSLADQNAGWAGLLENFGFELFLMLAVTVFIRVIVVTSGAILEEQVIIPGFFNRVRWQSHRYVSQQNLSFFQDDFAGRIATKIMQSGQATGDIMITALQVVWFIVIYSVSTIALVAGLDWRLSIIVAIWLAIFIVLARYFVPRVRKSARNMAEASSMINGRLTDSYSNIQTLKLFANREENDHFLKAGLLQFISVLKVFTRNITMVRASLALLSGVMIALIAGFSIDLWLKGLVSIGSVALAMSLVLRLSLLLGRLMTQLNALLRNFGTIQNSAEMISKPIGLMDVPNAPNLILNGSAIEFQNVNFDYLKDKPVIKDLSLSIQSGEKIGLIGPSGAGKSTLVNLLLRFFEPQNGHVYIDGQDISQFSQDSLRRHIGVVTQDTALLHRSIRDNILFGRMDAHEDELQNAIDKAEARVFIENLQDYKGRVGLDAHAGERGVKLSGGQRQRIAIARVILKNAPILVLDEATSALDSESEAIIQQHLEQLMDGKTVIAIAHRLSTIAKLDRLVVLNEGKIIEQGTHSELIAQKGLYARLWERQSGGFLPDDL